MFRYISDEYGCLDEIFRGDYTLEDWLRKVIRRCVKHIECRAEFDGLQTEGWSYDFEFEHKHWDIMISVEGRGAYMNEHQEELCVRGMELFSLVVDELNSIFCEMWGCEFFRRKEHFCDLCIALALLEKAQERRL